MKQPNCPVCKNNTQKYINNKLTLYRCTMCSLIFQSPQPSRKELKKLYENPLYFAFWGNPENSENIQQMKRKTAEIFLSELKNHIPDDRGKLLEIGCATGALLEVAKKNGYKITGVEISPYHAKIAEKYTGAKIIKSLYEEARFPVGNYDVIVFFDVLEHFSDLNAVMEKTKQLLKPNGLIAISTPNTSSLSCWIMKGLWPHFKKEHLFYFNAKSLTCLLSGYGFKIEKIKTSKKAITLNYIKSYFNVFTIPFLSAVLNFIVNFLPIKLRSAPFELYNGNMLVIARKK